MISCRATLWITRVYPSATIGDALGKFLRYLHYRDQLQRGDEGRGMAGLLRYVADRERASPAGRLFTQRRTVGDRERRALVAYVRRSLEDVPAEVLERRSSRLPAAYRFVFAPEDARGLDLRAATRSVMRQLERDSGVMPPWIAAEHRNTGYPHIHLVLAARYEVAPGQFHCLVVTRARLQRMKLALQREIERQRGERPIGRTREEDLIARSRGQYRWAERNRARARLTQNDPFHWPRRRERGAGGRARAISLYPLERALARLAAHWRRELEREEEEADRSRSRAEWSGRGQREREVSD